MAVAYVDRIGTNPTLAAPYSLGDPTITVDFCPADVSAKGPDFPVTVGSVLFRVTALGAGDVVWSVTRDPRTADFAQVVGTPVLIQRSGWQDEEPQQATFVTVNDETAQYPNSVQASTLAPGTHATTHENGGSDELALDWSQITTGVPSTFTPSAHAASHEDGGGDEIAVSEPMLAFTDVTTADADATKHGLLPKLSGDPDDALRGDGSWGAVASSGASGHYEVLMQGSAPPEPVTNQAEDDWLYIWIPD